MLYRKIRSYIEDHLRSNENKILLIECARQIGKSFITRDVGTELYDNYVEINFVADNEGDKIYDNKQKGDVDFLVDDSDTMSVLPIEVKSGKDYTVHSALDNLMAVTDYHIVSSIVFSNDRKITKNGNIRYFPIYYVMFLENKMPDEEDLYF